VAGFNFERNLLHQNDAIASILSAFNGATINVEKSPAKEKVCNPNVTLDELDFSRNLLDIQKLNQINKPNSVHKSSHVLDISMETGTGKTYTYTKAIFELNKEFYINKFIVVVPTLSIKAGTVSFLRSKATKEHFKQDYNKALKVHIVESSQAKNKKSFMPQAIVEFVEAQKNDKYIHVLVINGGMVNSDTLRKNFDRQIFDEHDTPIKAISSVKPFTIIDEPHKFKSGNTTWNNILQFESQYTLRFGATFNNNYENLIHELSAVDAFNQDLVKGVVTYVEQFADGNDTFIKLLRLFRDEPAEGGGSAKVLEAVFELNDGVSKKTFRLIKDASLESIHESMSDIKIIKHNQSVVVLSNGLEMKKGDKINPFSYSATLQDKMIEQAVTRHFELERNLLTRDVRIKPLTLFFIEDIEGYRGKHQIGGELRRKFEKLIKFQIKKLLKTETNDFYKSYLEKSLANLSLCHGGYFSKDNTASDDKIEKEVSEILHDKESLLSLDNTRRFIFSKWTLREGWDNPNVFQICKLRSSGSQTSKLQEVGRGLRLPVNEYMSRVKDEKFDLHYYVDFTEKDFAQQLVNDINAGSGSDAIDENKLSEALLNKINLSYPELDDEKIKEQLGELGVINFAHKFVDNGFEKLKSEIYPKAFERLKANKVRSSDKKKEKTSIRQGKYNELKALWESINQRVILEYKVDEASFKTLLRDYLLSEKDAFVPQGTVTKQSAVSFHNGLAFAREEDSVTNTIMPLVTMGYSDFLEALAIHIGINIKIVHEVFVDIQGELDINDYLSNQTIRAIKSGFNKFLLDSAISNYSIGYKKVSNKVHPTVFTDEKGAVLSEIPVTNIGQNSNLDKSPADQYLFEQVFYDSPLEEKNILGEIAEVTVFTKIPKDSIRIPVAGGGTYSPDFAYCVEYEKGQKSLNLIVETKDKDSRSLFREEEQKIKHAEKLFESLGANVSIKFETQFANNKMTKIINDAIGV